MRGYVSSIPFGCGVNNLCDYTRTHWHIWDNGKPTIDRLQKGAGWTFMAFINNKSSKKAYDYFTNLYEIVYQSPVRKNKNSNHLFFFIILDTSKVKDKSTCAD